LATALIVLLLLPLLALNAAAQTPTAPAADELRSRLAALAERKLPEADQRAAQQALEQALASLAIAADLRAQREALQASVAAAPQRLVTALAARAPELTGVEIYQLQTEGPAPYAAPGMEDAFSVNALFVGPNLRETVANGNGDYLPVFLSEAATLKKPRCAHERSSSSMEVTLRSRFRCSKSSTSRRHAQRGRCAGPDSTASAVVLGRCHRRSSGGGWVRCAHDRGPGARKQARRGTGGEPLPVIVSTNLRPGSGGGTNVVGAPRTATRSTGTPPPTAPAPTRRTNR